MSDGIWVTTVTDTKQLRLGRYKHQMGGEPGPGLGWPRRDNNVTLS